MAKSDPAEILSCLNGFYDFEAPVKIKAQSDGEAASSSACAISAIIGLQGHKRIFFKKNGFGLGPHLTIIGISNLNIILKIDFSHKSGLLTYKVHQGLSYLFSFVFLIIY
jgi:hypothetical protein